MINFLLSTINAIEAIDPGKAELINRMRDNEEISS